MANNNNNNYNYLNKIKVLDASGKVLPGEEFGFALGSLRVDESNGNIVYDKNENEQIILFQKNTDDGTYQLMIGNTSVQEYIDSRDSFLKEVSLEEGTGKLTLTFNIGEEDDISQETVDIELSKILSLHTYTELEPNQDFPSEPKEGDIAIVNSEISDNITGKTAYVYDGEDWKALDGNYSADNVYFDENMIYTADIGVLTLDGQGYQTLDTKGRTLKEVMQTILKKTIEPTIKSYPNASLTASCPNKDSSLEIGSFITSVSYTGSLSEDGDYETNGKETASGIKSSDLSWKVTLGDDSDTEKTTATGSYTTKIQIDSTTANTVYATVNATATLSLDNVVTPTNNLGEASTTVKIKGFDSAGTTIKSLTANVTASGYRNTWYYVGTDYEFALNSANIRTKATAKNSNTTSFGTVTIPAGTKRVMFAVLGDKTLKSVIDVDGQNLDVKENFTKETVAIQGANSFKAANYSVFHFENENGIAATKYTVTIG